ncbi:hypothetical protein FCV25MIE_34766, partial [Fagus crenata]
MASSFSLPAVVVRDEIGACIRAENAKSSTTEPEIAEAEAFLWAVKMARVMNSIKVNFEGDSKLCVDSICSKGVLANWKSVDVIRDIVDQSSSFLACQFTWVPRSANQAPHVLGKWALHKSFVGQLVDFSVSPSFVEVLASDS